MPRSPLRRLVIAPLVAARSAGAPLAALAALAGAPAAAQETTPTDAPAAQTEAQAGAPARDPRPQAHAYTVVDGRSIPVPLGGAQGDPARGREIFADPALGGCRACHAAPGLPEAMFVPQVLADRAPRPAPEAAAPPALDDPAAEAEEAEPGSTSDSRLAPEAAAPPPARPAADAETADEAGEGADAPEDDGSGALDAAAAALLPLPHGPDLAGVAARLEVGEIRLLVVNPRIARAGSRMPAYHTISLAQAALTPALRQPWLGAQEVEDLVAYLATLYGAAAPAETTPVGAQDEGEAADATAPPGSAESAPAATGEEGVGDGSAVDAPSDDAAPATVAPQAGPEAAGEEPARGVEAVESAPDAAGEAPAADAGATPGAAEGPRPRSEAPSDSTPSDSTPSDSTPSDSTPSDSTPADPTPDAPTPPDGAPADTAN